MKYTGTLIAVKDMEKSKQFFVVSSLNGSK